MNLGNLERDNAANQDEKSTPASNQSIQDPAIRENMVDAAVRFLTNPRVQQNSLSSRKMFLLKKGLTNEEIEAASTRAHLATQEPDNLETSGSNNMDQSPHSQLPLIAAGGSQSPGGAFGYMPNRSNGQSFFVSVRQTISTALFVSFLAYGGYYVWEEYVSPYLTGRKRKSLEQEMIAIHSQLTKQMMELNERLRDVQTALNDQNRQLLSRYADSGSGNISSGVSGSMPNTVQVSLNDLKNDIASIKGLMLNKDQFPPLPAVSGCSFQPSWQLQSKRKEGDSAPSPSQLTSHPELSSETEDGNLPVEPLHTTADCSSVQPRTQSLISSQSDQVNGLDNSVISADGATSSPPPALTPLVNSNTNCSILKNGLSSGNKKNGGKKAKITFALNGFANDDKRTDHDDKIVITNGESEA